MCAKTEKSNPRSVLKRLFRRYFIDVMGAMALGLFSSLIIGLIIGQLARIPFLSFLQFIADMLSASSPVVGAAIGVAVAHGLKAKPLAVFSCAAVGALGYVAGGPVGCFIAAVVGAELGTLIGGRTPVDIVLIPLVTLVAGGLTANFVGPGIGGFMDWLGGVVNSATYLAPVPMGIVVSVVMGLALTAPISSAAIAISLGLSGIAAGASAVGCCCQMVGFAVASFKDNGWGGLISQGLGTSMLQFPNIVKRPQIWLAPTLASAVLGPISSAVFGMTNTPAGAGMGTSGLVGQFGAWAAMSETSSPAATIGLILLMHFLLPAIVTLGFDQLFRKIGLIKPGDMKLSAG
ncbi:MAG: PTS transporter subunit IIC [Christensenellales bacterium]|jgi:uncharacterized membrane protein